MARVSGPLFSMSASGTVGKAITFGTWKGRPWCRVWFKPENPNTALQVNVRYAMSLLVAYWQVVVAAHTSWDTYADQFNMSGFNKFVSHGMAAYVSQITTAVTPVSVSLGGSADYGETWTWA